MCLAFRLRETDGVTAGQIDFVRVTVTSGSQELESRELSAADIDQQTGSPTMQPGEERAFNLSVGLDNVLGPDGGLARFDFLVQLRDFSGILHTLDSEILLTEVVQSTLSCSST